MDQFKTVLAVDVHYTDNNALVAGVLFDDWQASKPQKVLLSEVKDSEAYEPGSFYKREQPAILHLLKDHQLHPDLIVVDGYVFLDGKQKAGLGKILFNSLEQKIPIIGVAKKPFKDIGAKFEVKRGTSKNPLYVTSVGFDVEDAKDFVRNMHGKHRIPTLLKYVDQLARGLCSS